MSGRFGDKVLGIARKKATWEAANGVVLSVGDENKLVCCNSDGFTMGNDSSCNARIAVKPAIVNS